MKHFYKELNKDFVSLFNAKIRKSKSIIITSHLTPDDDSIASVLSMYYYLTKVLAISEEKIRMLYSAVKSDRWEYFYNYEKIEFMDDIKREISAADTIILLDCSGWDRISRSIKSGDYSNFTICLDHHPRPSLICDLHILIDNYSSTSELIFEMFFKDREKLDKDICEILLMGIMGDTGSFRFVSPTISTSYLAAKRLVDDGEIYVEELWDKYESVSIETIRIYATYLKKMTIRKIVGWPVMITSTLTMKEKAKYKLSSSNLDEARNMFKWMLKSVKGVPWGFVVEEKGDNCGVSFRSLPKSVDVRDIVDRLGIGGGHPRAAAGSFKNMNAREAMKILEDWMKTNKPKYS